jgi:3'-5' exonuclease
MITHIIESIEELHSIEERLMRDVHRNGIVAFDSEFNADGSVAVVQLMATRHVIYIIRTSLLPEFPEILKSIMLDSRIVKVGHSLESDERAMRRNFGFGIASKLDVRHVLMSLRAKVPSMGIKSNLKGLMEVLVPEVPTYDLRWWEKVDWSHFNPQRVAYLEGDVRGVYEICAKVMMLDRFRDLQWDIFQARVPGIESYLDRDVTLQSWYGFNCK